MGDHLPRKLARICAGGEGLVDEAQAACAPSAFSQASVRAITARVAGCAQDLLARSRVMVSPGATTSWSSRLSASRKAARALAGDQFNGSRLEVDDFFFGQSSDAPANFGNRSAGGN